MDSIITAYKNNEGKNIVYVKIIYDNNPNTKTNRFISANLYSLQEYIRNSIAVAFILENNYWKQYEGLNIDKIPDSEHREFLGVLNSTINTSLHAKGIMNSEGKMLV